MHRTALVVVALAIAVAPRPALALRPQVAAAVALYDDARFDDAGRAFEAALQLAGNRAEDLAAIYFHLGLLAGAAGREDEARTHFERALVLDPGLSLPEPQQPGIAGAFERAAGRVRGARLRVDHRRPDGLEAGAPASLRFEVAGDLLAMVEAARLVIWSDEDDRERAIRLEGEGPFDLPVPADLLAAAGRCARPETVEADQGEDTVQRTTCRELRYRLELLGSASSVLAERNDEVERGVPVWPRPRTLLETETCTSDDDCVGDEVCHAGRCAIAMRRRIYNQWWFWTVIGVVAVGVAVAVPLALFCPSSELEGGAPTLTR